MKLLIFIALLSSFVFTQENKEIPPKVQKKIDEAVDYYKLNLYDDSKKLLLELLYSDDGEKFESEIRYHLGIASYIEGSFSGATNQWNLLRKKYPSSSRAKEISRVYNTFLQEVKGDSLFEDESFEFQNDIRFSNLFWTSKYAERKLMFGELVDPARAVEFYEKLYDKYDDPEKKFLVAVRLFYLYAGFNKNNYGFNNQSAYGPAVSENKLKKYSNAQFKSKAIGMLKKMESHVYNKDNIYFNELVASNYVFAIRLSDQAFWSAKVKANKDSEPFFAKVVSLTQDSQNDLYRTFSILWLAEKANKYVVTEETLNKWESLGLTKKEIYFFNSNAIPEGLWKKAQQKNFDTEAPPLPEALSINLKIEKLLDDNSLINNYSSEQLESEIADTKNGYKIYFLTKFNFLPEDSNLQKFAINFFNECNDLECLNKYSSSINAQIRTIHNKQRIRSRVVSDNLFKLRSSLSLSTIMLINKNNIDLNTFSNLLANNIEFLLTNN